MRRAFEKTIDQYRDLARKEVDLSERDSESKELELLGYIVDWHTKDAARRRKTSAEDQKEIYDIQTLKQKLMNKLKQDIADCDKPDVHAERDAQRADVHYDAGLLYFEREDGSKQNLTIGELMTDMSWGMQYNLDESVPRQIRKQYLIETAKNDLKILLDQQIALDELGSEYTREGKKQAYVKKIMEQGRETRSGKVAEKMVENYFRKLSYDTNADVRVLSADIFQDVTQKIDFIVRVTHSDHNRGVNVNETRREDVGIQFSINASPEAVRRKQLQVQEAKKMLREKGYPIHDILFVSIPIQHTNFLYNQWNKNRAPGGPEKLWDEKTKETIFKGVLSGVFSKEELDEQWDTINREVMEQAA